MAIVQIDVTRSGFITASTWQERIMVLCSKPAHTVWPWSEDHPAPKIIDWPPRRGR